jgi:hypothetical protein
MDIIKPHLRAMAQELLQARLDGKLRRTADFLLIIHRHSPPSGLTREDINDIGEFMNEIIPCNKPQSAKTVASKHELQLDTKEKVD